MNVFFQDPWWLILIKVVALFVVLLVWTILNIWYERRLVAKMQHRIGPIMNGPFGLGQSLADGVKILIKEGFKPAKADGVIFTLAPILTGVAAFTSWSVIPFGGEVQMFGVTTRLQLTDMPVATLFILAIASIGIYGIVLAGWASNSTYSLLGSLRSSAQMISYEVSMGLALVGVFMFSGSMSTYEIVESQARSIVFFGVTTGIPSWYWLILLPSFAIYVISMVGETNRAPFDLPECESELVAGYMTEYSGARFMFFYLAEYINMATVSAVATTLFLGGYLTPWPLNNIEFFNNPWFGPVWFIIKAQLFISFFVWLRGTLPRFRYDQFMDLGWKWLIPISLLWIVAVASFKSAMDHGWLATPIGMIVVGAVVVALLVYAFFGGQEPERKAAPPPTGAFDPFAGGYPVPPMPGQTLPELAGVVSAAAQDNDELEAPDGNV